MEIAGEWQVHEDGQTRPMIHATVVGADGTRQGDDFIIDTGADQTVFSGAFFARLGFAVTPPTPGTGLTGIGGAAEHTEIETELEFVALDGTPVRVKARYAAFTGTEVLAYSILGRDALRHFDLIVSEKRSEIRLLCMNHHYQILSR